ncbi:MAG: hypothetical protein QUS33_03615 [Dehalococcoidia bacterium]|nr:hypothetical protein [Dehalococcoidia bacterium]
MSNAATVSRDANLPQRIAGELPSVAGTLKYSAEILLLPNDPTAAQLLEAEEFETTTWKVIDREGCSGIPTSGFDMVTDSEHNYLRKEFHIADGGDWLLDICYFAHLDTGMMEVYVDGTLIGTVDTYYPTLAKKDYSVTLSLTEGWHDIRLVGRQSERETPEGGRCNWVEVDRIALLNQDALPRLVSESRELWVRIAQTCAVQQLTIEAEDCASEGWVLIDREGCGVPTSGYDMAVPDVTQAEDNYLRKSFLIGRAGNWTLDVSYFAHVDTGKIDIYVDDALVGSVDTFCSWMPKRTYSFDLYLDVGLHQVKVVGRPSDRDITVGSLGNWVEIDRMVLSYQDEVPPEPPTQDAARISNFRLSPRGLSLDIEAAEDGILSIAYYANPWWRVYVDGKETEVITINGLFPGCYVEGGQHHVEFVFSYPTLANLFGLLK